jgi:hypothetical protein
MAKRRAFLLLAAALACAPACANPPVITLVGATDTRQSVHGPWLEMIYREAFRRLGYRLQYLDYPANKASSLSDQGLVDGEIHRVADYGQAHPNLVRVEEPHFSMAFAAYGIPPLWLGGGWRSLRTTAYRVDYRLGVKKAETELPLVVDAARLSATVTTADGLRLLEAHKLDLFVDVDDVVQAVLASKEFRGSPVRRIAFMEQIDVHAFLHKRHRDLAPRLAEVLREMKREGLVEEYHQQALALRAKGN